MSESAAPAFEEPALKRAKIEDDGDKPTAAFRSESYAIIVYDFEARGDITGTSKVLFGPMTLASIGASWFIVQINYKNDKITYANLRFPKEDESAPLPFSDTFPTMFTDEEWAKLPVTASSFWERNPEAFNALKENGHVVKEAEQVFGYMSASAKRFQAWLDSIRSYMAETSSVTGLIMATDTASSDSKRLASYMATADLLSPPYNQAGKYNGIREWNYDQLLQDLRLMGKEGEPDLKSALVPVQRNHLAVDDAAAQAYEAYWILVWAVADTKDFEDYTRAMKFDPTKTPNYRLAPERARRLQHYLTHL